MSVIFFDLETSDIAPIGQILSFAFVEVNSKFEEVSRLTGKIKLSRTQLPSAGAVLANRISIMEHQTDAEYTEPQAMRVIHNYLQGKADQERTYLIGKRSYRFDIPYLRTSLIRNGFPCYFGKNMINRDLQHVITHLYFNNESYRSMIQTAAALKGVEVRIRALEFVAQTLGVLTEAQTHDALDDVLLTIKVAKELKDRYGIDVVKWHPYDSPKIFERNNELAVMRHYDRETQQIVGQLVYPFRAGKAYSLWINISKCLTEQLEDERDYLKWINTNDGHIDLCSVTEFEQNHYMISDQMLPLVEQGIIEDTSIRSMEYIAEQFKEKFSWITYEKYFNAMNCDVEQHIYNVSFRGIECLCHAIQRGDITSLKHFNDPFALELYKRYLINNSTTTDTPKFTKILREYAQYRYLGGLDGYQCKLKKFNNIHRSSKDPGAKKEDFHPEFQDMYQEIETQLKLRTDAEDQEILNSLKQYYETSLIGKTCLQLMKEFEHGNNEAVSV